jgi:hypothetical protein
MQTFSGDVAMSFRDAFACRVYPPWRRGHAFPLNTAQNLWDGLFPFTAGTTMAENREASQDGNSNFLNDGTTSAYARIAHGSQDRQIDEKT